MLEEIHSQHPLGKYSHIKWIYLLNSLNTSTMYPIAHVPHVPHYPCAPSRFSRYWHYSLNTWSCTWPHIHHVSHLDLIEKMSKMSTRCQMSINQTPGLWLWRLEIINWRNEVHIYLSIVMSHMMVIKNSQNVHGKYFWSIFLTFTCDFKIDINMCEPHYVNLFFCELPL